MHNLKSSQLLECLFSHPVRVLDNSFVSKVKEEFYDQELLRLSVHHHTNSQYKELATLLLLILVTKEYSNNGWKSLNVKHPCLQTDFDPTKVLQYVKVNRIGEDDAKTVSTLSQVSVYDLIKQYSTQSPESESPSWEELKAVCNTLIECSIFPNIPKFEINIPLQFIYFVNGITHLFKSLCTPDRVQHLEQAFECLSFSYAIFIEDISYWVCLKDFIEVIPDERLEAFVSSLLISGNIEIDQVVSLLKTEQMFCYPRFDTARSNKISTILNGIKKARAKPQDLTEIIAKTTKEQNLDLLNVSVNIRESNLDDEGRLFALFNIVGPLYSTSKVKEMAYQLRVLTFEFIRIITHLLENGSGMHRMAPFLTVIVYCALNFLKDEEMNIILKVFINYMTPILSSTHDNDTRYHLANILSCMYSSLADRNPSITEYREKEEELQNICNQIAAECNPDEPWGPFS